jgi:DNA polymerase-3 subunit delta'
MNICEQPADNYNLYSWHKNAWQSLWEAKQNHRLPHALLIVGKIGIGKEHLAKRLASTILCSHPEANGSTCGVCHSCHLIRAGSHPDLKYIAAESPGNIIKIEQIREVVQFVNETSMQNGFKIVIINNAHHMNRYAANALLKTLEEPPTHTLFILITIERKRLPATITSRCQKLILDKPDDSVALDWLQSQLSDPHLFSKDTQQIALHLAGGAPLKALSILTNDIMAYRQTVYEGLAALHLSQADPLQLAAQWHERDMETLFHLLFYWIHDILKLKLTQNTSVIVNVDYKDVLTKMTQKLQVNFILSYLDEVQNRYAKIVNSLNLNRQLLVEELLIRWVSINKM